jgi:glyceraldehyde 3-phosphate dehydrogenase
VRVGINGFGRMGRLALRAAWQRSDIEVVAINEPYAPAENLALLLEFDSVQGRWGRTVRAESGALLCEQRSIPVSSALTPSEIDWAAHGVELVLECSGKFRKPETLQPHLQSGVQAVLVSAPVGGDVPDIVVGVNHDAYDLAEHPLLTAASCTTNCLAPVVRIVHDNLGIVRGLVTTIHNPTNTQRVHDAAHKDPRRARAAQLNLIPTSTNSAVAVTRIIPELLGKLDSLAVRAPVLNASLTDCVFQLAQDTSVEELNALLRAASESSRLRGILGYEERPLVSSDYAGDPRSGVVDAASTRVTDRRLAKILVWYDNEWGYANRLVELAGMIAAARGA